MSAVPKPYLTPDQYLAIERKAAFKSEYFAGEMFAMAGASYRHTRVNDNLVGELHVRCKDRKCFPLSRDMRLKVSATGLYTYPDLVLVCGKPEFEDDVFDTLLNPKVAIEILSESTEKYDRGKKFRHYQQVHSLEEYVLVSQDEPAIDCFHRQPDGSWNVTSVVGLDSELVLKSVPVRIALAEIYAGVEFDPPNPDDPSSVPIEHRKSP